MDAEEFREFGYAAIDFVADYLENVRYRQVLPSVKPGYLHHLLPTEVPEDPENWKDVMQDVNDKIMPGITHWISPHFHAYFPTPASYPSIIGDMIASGFGIIGFSWISSPACTELEVIVMDWLGKFLALPKEFLNSSEGPGGGVIQGSASEAALVAVLTAREQSVKRLQIEYSHLSESEIRGKLVMYSSDQCNSAVEKAALLAAVQIRLLPVDNEGSLRGSTLKEAIDEDIRKGNFPIACVANLGTTGICAFDNLTEIGPICREHEIWLHVDAAYAGSALCCPEFRYLMPGIEFTDSFNYNLHKWMMVHFDCSAMWFRDATQVVDALTVDRAYLKHQFEGNSKAPDYRHWQIPLGRRFRAMKVWFALRTIGAKKIRESIREHVRLGAKFAKLVSADSRFEMIGKQTLGLVCFRLKGDCSNTQRLLDNLMQSKKIYVVSEIYNNRLIVRFVINGSDPKEEDMEFAWNEIIRETAKIFNTFDKTPIKFTANIDALKYEQKLSVKPEIKP